MLKTLRDCLLKGGIKRKIFVYEQEITQRKRYYKVLDIGATGINFTAQAFLVIRYLNPNLKPSKPTTERIFLARHLDDRLYELTPP